MHCKKNACWTKIKCKCIPHDNFYRTLLTEERYEKKDILRYSTFYSNLKMALQVDFYFPYHELNSKDFVLNAMNS